MALFFYCLLFFSTVQLDKFFFSTSIREVNYARIAHDNEGMIRHSTYQHNQARQVDPLPFNIHILPNLLFSPTIYKHFIYYRGWNKGKKRSLDSFTTPQIQVSLCKIKLGTTTHLPTLASLYSIRPLLPLTLYHFPFSFMGRAGVCV